MTHCGIRRACRRRRRGRAASRCTASPRRASPDAGAKARVSDGKGDATAAVQLQRASVTRTPGSGFMPNMRSVCTCAWPPPTSTRSRSTRPASMAATAAATERARRCRGRRAAGGPAASRGRPGARSSEDVVHAAGTGALLLAAHVASATRGDAYGMGASALGGKTRSLRMAAVFAGALAVRAAPLAAAPARRSAFVAAAPVAPRNAASLRAAHRAAPSRAPRGVRTYAIQFLKDLVNMSRRGPARAPPSATQRQSATRAPPLTPARNGFCPGMPRRACACCFGTARVAPQLRLAHAPAATAALPCSLLTRCFLCFFFDSVPQRPAQA